MPFDQVNFVLPAVETDAVLRILIGLRGFHSDPANWCNTGMMDGDARCIIAGANHVARQMGLDDGGCAPDGVRLAIRSVIPCGILSFNEGQGTTHAELVAMYDRAIASRRAAIASRAA